MGESRLDRVGEQGGGNRSEGTESDRAGQRVAGTSDALLLKPSLEPNHSSRDPHAGGILTDLKALAYRLERLFVKEAEQEGRAILLAELALAAGAIAAWTELGPLWGGVAGGASVLATGAMLYWLPKSRLGRRMVLEHSQADAVSQADRSELVGRRGITVTPLRTSLTQSDHLSDLRERLKR